VAALVPGLLGLLLWALRKQRELAKTNDQYKEPGKSSDDAFIETLFEGSSAGFAKAYLKTRRSGMQFTGTDVNALLALRASLAAPDSWMGRVCRRHRGHLRTAGLCGMLLCAQVLNKVLFKMLLVSTGPYTQFLSIATNLVYISFFGSTFRMRLRSGVASPEVLEFARGRKELFAGMGVCEAVAFALLPWATARLPGAWLPILGQSLLPFTMLTRRVLLDQSYSAAQLAGVALVIVGVAANVVPQLFHRTPAPGGTSDASVILPACVLCAAYGFMSISFTFKDLAFRACSAQTGKQLDVFLVDAYSAVFQGLVLNWLWPASFEFLTPLSPGAYLRQAYGAFLGAAGGGMPWLILLYWGLNCFYRVVQLRVVQELSSLAVLLTNVLTVPLSSLVFCMPLPLLAASSFSPYLVLSLVVIGLGLLVFNAGQLRAQLRPAPKQEEAEESSGEESDGGNSGS